MARRRPRARNPLDGVIGWFLTGLFFLAAITAYTGEGWPSSRYVLSGILLAGGGVGTAWTLFGIRAGRLSIVSPNTGSVSTVERRTEPILFFVVLLMYLFAGIGAIWLGLGLLVS